MNIGGYFLDLEILKEFVLDPMLEVVDILSRFRSDCRMFQGNNRRKEMHSHNF